MVRGRDTVSDVFDGCVVLERSCRVGVCRVAMDLIVGMVLVWLAFWYILSSLSSRRAGVRFGNASVVAAVLFSKKHRGNAERAGFLIGCVFLWFGVAVLLLPFAGFRNAEGRSGPMHPGIAVAMACSMGLMSATVLLTGVLVFTGRPSFLLMPGKDGGG